MCEIESKTVEQDGFKIQVTTYYDYDHDYHDGPFDWQADRFQFISNFRDLASSNNAEFDSIGDMLENRDYDYTLEEDDPDYQPETLTVQQFLERNPEYSHVGFVYGGSHSGIWLSSVEVVARGEDERTHAMRTGWDTGCMGVVLAKGSGKVEIESIVETFGHLVEGRVARYWLEVTDENGEEVGSDSCGGFIGDEEFCMEEGLEEGRSIVCHEIRKRKECAAIMAL